MKRRKHYTKRKSGKPKYGLIVVAIILLCVLAYSSQGPTNPTPKSNPSSQTFSFKAAIVDQLSLAQPNPTFNQTATAILETAGFTVDYYPGEEVTVRFYRNLPLHDYGLIVLRVHSGTDYLFTSESYSTAKYVSEQLNDQVGCAAYFIGGDPYFCVNWQFVQAGMNGKLQNTIVIMMGCDLLESTLMAAAFESRGAKVCVGWNGLVTAPHTDSATTHLLQHLVLEKQTIKTAVEETMREVGPDPESKSKLSIFPFTNEAQNFIIPDKETI